METLELKHLAPYLPYELKIIHLPTKEQDKLTSLCHILGIGTNIDNYDFIDIDKVKPILRPLSDLTKEIKINNEKFIPIDKINNRNQLIKKEFDIYIDLKGDTRLLYIGGDNRDFIRGFNPKEKLIEWHFDVFGLIEKGLAIDINTI